MECSGQSSWCNKKPGIERLHMSEAELIKNTIINNMQKLCAHCVNGNLNHNCPLHIISEQIKKISGVPLIVNNEFKGIIFR
jgi:nitrate reductase beta subunit